MQTLTREPVSAPGQLITITVTYEGVERDVAVFVPSSHEPSTAMPLRSTRKPLKDDNYGLEIGIGM